MLLIFRNIFFSFVFKSFFNPSSNVSSKLARMTFFAREECLCLLRRELSRFLVYWNISLCTHGALLTCNLQTCRNRTNWTIIIYLLFFLSVRSAQYQNKEKVFSIVIGKYVDAQNETKKIVEMKNLPHGDKNIKFPFLDVVLRVNVKRVAIQFLL
jgi:hypothetical protein